MLASLFNRLAASLSRGSSKILGGEISQLRSELAGSTALLALASIPSPVSALTVATVAATSTAEWSSLALALAEHATGRSVRSLLLNVGSGNDLSGQVKPFAKVVKTLGGQGVVVVLPRELGLDIAARVQGLASLDDKEVLGVDVGVLGEVEVLLCDEDALAEEVLAENVSHQISLNLPVAVEIPRGSSCGRPWESTSWRLDARGDVGSWQFFRRACQIKSRNG